MFGTFQEELHPVVYGTVEPMHTWDPLEANIGIWRKIIQKAKKCSSWTDSLLCFIKVESLDLHIQFIRFLTLRSDGVTAPWVGPCNWRGIRTP
jgi:hypothetical protein